MREVGRDLSAWLAEGARIYVCGDAKHMARDVERTLTDVVATFGVRSTNEAVAFVADLKKTGRYQQNVYWGGMCIDMALRSPSSPPPLRGRSSRHSASKTRAMKRREGGRYPTPRLPIPPSPSPPPQGGGSRAVARR